MNRIVREAFVAAPPGIAFDVVAAVERYPEFLGDVKAVRRTGDIVEMTVQAGPLELTFANRARFDRPRRIDLDLVRGPFKAMQAAWQFTPEAGGTRVRYEAAFELALKVPGAGRVVAAALAANAERTVEAFRQRAEAAARQQTDVSGLAGG